MKYLKSIYESKYSEIDGSECMSLLKSLRHDMFNNDEINILKKMDFEFDISDNMIVFYQYDHNKMEDIEYAIYKLQDEWFLVEVMFDEVDGFTYYKCDQLEGLISWLKSLKLETMNESKDTNPIDELAEYLQEFFDKWNIVERTVDMVRGSQEELAWYVYHGEKINIVNIPVDRYDLIKIDLIKRMPLLRTRMGFGKTNKDIDIHWAKHIGRINIYTD